MAFNPDYLTCLGTISYDKPNMWVYKTEDGDEDIDTAADGYFPAGAGIKPGDLVYVVQVANLTLSAKSQTVSAAAFHVVTSVDEDGADVGGATSLTVATGSYPT